MPTFDISINIYIFLLILAGAVLTGFARRSRQISKKNRRIAELKREMIQAHAELLETQKDYCALESKVKDINSPVIAMKNSKNDDSPQKPIHRPENIRTDRATGTD